jgi:hypothetical protein
MAYGAVPAFLSTWLPLDVARRDECCCVGGSSSSSSRCDITVNIFVVVSTASRKRRQRPGAPILNFPRRSVDREESESHTFVRCPRTDDGLSGLACLLCPFALGTTKNLSRRRDDARFQRSSSAELGRRREGEEHTPVIVKSRPASFARTFPRATHNVEGI